MSTEAEMNVNQEEMVSTMELPAPPGWKKQLGPKKGGTPRKSEIVFTAPTGEEIHSQRQLQQYLKSHPGGPPVSDFDWGTGETPRRSSRISEKAKAAPQTPESDPPKKRSRKSSASKKDGVDSEATGEEKDAQKTGTEKAGGEAEDVQMKEAEKTSKVSVDSKPKEDLETEKQESKEREERAADNGEKTNDDAKNIKGGKEIETSQSNIADEVHTGENQPKPEGEKQDGGVQEPVKLDEPKPEPKDNATPRGTLEKAAAITENGAQAVEAGI